MYGLLHGLEPHRLDDNILRFTGGSVASFNAPWDVMNFPSPHNDVSLLRQGLWGVDQDPATLPTFADLFPYVIKHPETGEAGIILSQVNFTAAMPPGFEMQRKLPFGVVLSGQKKLRPYHLRRSCGIPLSRVGARLSGRPCRSLALVARPRLGLKSTSRIGCRITPAA
jgi:hypothetical protein